MDRNCAEKEDKTEEGKNTPECLALECFVCDGD